ncbi:MAG: hypothetical protein ABI433_09335 [Burkholderiaceae bacterium]
MSVIADVFDSLRAMSLLQLLLAFVACTGYSLAQGALVSSPRVRGVAGASALVGAIAYAILGTEWMHAAMLVAFAFAGMGVFVAVVWVTSRLLGFAGERSPRSDDESQLAVRSRASRPPPTTEHAHSV